MFINNKEMIACLTSCLSFAKSPRCEFVSKALRLFDSQRVEEIEDPLTQQVRYLDKLVDELAKGKKMEKILRSS